MCLIKGMKCPHDIIPKIDGIPVELADIIIRILDYCGYLNIDIGTVVEDKINYNIIRGFRHGNKRA